MSETFLTSNSHSHFRQNSDLTPVQVQMDGIVSTFVEKAMDGYSLFGIMLGGATNRLVRVGTLTASRSLVNLAPRIFPPVIRGAALGAGFLTESIIFDTAPKVTKVILGGGEISLLHLYGDSGMIKSAVHTGVGLFGLKLAGVAGIHQGPIAQNLMQCGAMVASHYAAAALGIGDVPRESLGHQLAEAEATVLHLWAGMRVLHQGAPGLAQREQAIDLSILAKEIEFSPLSRSHGLPRNGVDRNGVSRNGVSNVLYSSRPQIGQVDIPTETLGTRKPLDFVSNAIGPLAAMATVTGFSALAEALAGGMSLLTVTAAVTGSAPLARVVSKPFFEAPALALGIYNIVAGNIAIGGALLAFTGMGYLLRLYSFYRGTQTAREVFRSSLSLNALDWTEQIYSEELAENLLQIRSEVDKIVAANNKDKIVLLEGLEKATECLELCLQETLSTTEHLEGLGEEKPQRIEAAFFSSLEAQDRASGDRSTRVRLAKESAQKTVDDLLKTVSGKVEELAKSLESMKTATSDPVDSHLKKALEKVHLLKDLLGHPDRAIKTYRVLGQSKEHRRVLQKTVSHAFESERIASSSPTYMKDEARGDPGMSDREKGIRLFLGDVTQKSLLWGIPFFCALQVFTGGVNFSNVPDFFRTFLTTVFGLTPAAAAYLANARRQGERFGILPGLIQNMGADLLQSQKAQQRGIERGDEAIPPMPPYKAKKYVQKMKKILDEFMEEVFKPLFEELRRAAIPTPKAEKISETLVLERKKDEPLRFTPRAPNPDRRYKYTEFKVADTPKMKKLRQEVKAMPPEDLDQKIMKGDITHEDIFNMIRGHRVAKDGAIIPRSIEGELERRTLELVREADRMGVVKHFILVKDLMAGLDGLANAGSETMSPHLPESLLMERLIELGYIPIPCSMSAGAQGGTGLYVGHGAVGNPKFLGYCAAGSSGPEAYLLGLDDFPIRLAITSDTFGSTAAPAGAVKLAGFVPERDTISRRNIIASAAYLDTPAIMGVDKAEVLKLARQLTLPSYQHRFEPSSEKPTIVSFESDDALVSSRRKKQMERIREELKKKGHQVVMLKKRPTFTLDFYNAAYASSLLVQMGADHEGIEPPRYLKDRNLIGRYGKGLLLLKTPYEKHGNLFNAFVAYTQRSADLLNNELFNKNVVVLSPTAEAVPLKDFLPGRKGGEKTDNHDKVAASWKNLVGKAMITDSVLGLSWEGNTRAVMHVSKVLENIHGTLTELPGVPHKNGKSTLPQNIEIFEVPANDNRMSAN
jgi:Asp-tRNA(Asn)/Glu-tRNA(Gln) amidotransferase A subunit family amidase